MLCCDWSEDCQDRENSGTDHWSVRIGEGRILIIQPLVSGWGEGEYSLFQNIYKYVIKKCKWRVKYEPVSSIIMDGSIFK